MSETACLRDAHSAATDESKTDERDADECERMRFGHLPNAHALNSCISVEIGPGADFAALGLKVGAEVVVPDVGKQAAVPDGKAAEIRQMLFVTEA